MRSTSANSIAFILLLSCITACSYKSEKDMATGRWKYLSVTKAERPLFEISDNDYLQLNKDSTFHYRISSVGKFMKGTWNYSDHALHLHYEMPDTTRHFEVDLLTKHNLHFHEGEVSFKYSRLD